MPASFLLSLDESNKPSLKCETFYSMMHLGQHIDLFEPLFQALGILRSPFYVLTPIADGCP